MHRYLFILSLVLVAASPASAPNLTIVNRVDSFERFYARASHPDVDEAQRWKLWRSMYHMAAVPPGPAGEKMAHRMLDGAWPRYASLVPHLQPMAASARSEADAAFASLNRLFDSTGLPIHTVLVLYVGQFDNNAYTIPQSGSEPATVMIPVENVNRRVAIAHELAHSIDFQLAGVRNSFGAPIGETIFLEGLAMHASKAVVPGLSDERYTELPDDHGWLKACRANHAAILKGISPYLRQSGPSIAMRFTFGSGTTGLRREAYCAGWIVVGDMLKTTSFAELARIPEDRMTTVVANAIHHIH